jgi:uncharacterized protein YbbK (DUF523 family)
MKIVSACLAGINCNYKGQASPCPKVIELVKQGKAIPVCPEQLGGLTTPRTPAEIKNGKVITRDGRNVTEYFQKGAIEGLKIALIVKCDQAILKARSPSCGKGEIYDGTFTKTKVKGNGLFADKLIKSNIQVVTEEEL